MESSSVIQLVIQNEEAIYFLILVVFLGLALISNVPAILHTPLMSGANAISGVILIGAIISISALPDDDYLGLFLGFLAVTLGTVNVVGGFMVTDRMLNMFKKKK
ncbi:MAG: NAD(P) transhydrogenase subunit alpha [Flavobacteriales bacterium]